MYEKRWWRGATSEHANNRPCTECICCIWDVGASRLSSAMGPRASQRHPTFNTPFYEYNASFKFYIAVEKFKSCLQNPH